jgi:hypothetical protein
MSKKPIKLPPIPLGETLREDFLIPLNLSVNRLAMDLRVPVTRMEGCAGSVLASGLLNVLAGFGR